MKVHELGASYLELNMSRNIGDVRVLARLISRLSVEKPDILQCHLFRSNLYGRPAARICRGPKVISVFHNVEEYMVSSGIPNRAARSFEFLSRALVSKYVAVSLRVAQALTRNLTIEQDKVSVVHNGVADVTYEREARDEIRLELGFEQSAFLVGSVARLHSQKRLQDLISSVALLRRSSPDAGCVLIGEGPERAALERQISALGLQRAVRLLGPRSDVPRLLPALDAFALSSEYEGLPVALLEAMRAGLPCVVTDAGGMAEVVVNGETGMVVGVGDVHNFTLALSELAVNDLKRKSLGRASRERFLRRFSSKEMAAKYSELYESLGYCTTGLCKPTGRYDGAEQALLK